MRRYLFPWHHKVRLQLAVDGAIKILSSQFSFLDHCVGHFCVAAATLIERPGTLTQEFLLWKRCAKKWRRSSGADETSDRRNADRSTEKQPTGQTRAEEPSQGLVGVPTRVAARPPTNAKGLNTTISSVHSVNSVLSCPCVPNGSHMRQDFLISLTPPRRGAAFPLCGLLTAETWLQRIGHKLPVNIAVPGMCFNACFTPRWDTSGRTTAVTVISTKPGGTRTVTLGTSPNLHLQPCNKCTNSDFPVFFFFKTSSVIMTSTLELRHPFRRTLCEKSHLSIYDVCCNCANQIISLYINDAATCRHVF